MGGGREMALPLVLVASQGLKPTAWHLDYCGSERGAMVGGCGHDAALPIYRKQWCPEAWSFSMPRLYVIGVRTERGLTLAPPAAGVWWAVPVLRAACTEQACAQELLAYAERRGANTIASFTRGPLLAQRLLHTGC